MTGLGDQIRDIHGLDSVSWLPLPFASWLLLAGLALCLLLILLWRWWRRDWRVYARIELRALQSHLAGRDLKVWMGEFSALTRRIAMARLGRQSCAGLSGSAWLAWLTANDPKGFDWSEQGRLLITLPYAPPNSKIPQQKVGALIGAISEWIEVKDEKIGDTKIGDRPRFFSKKRGLSPIFSKRSGSDV